MVLEAQIKVSMDTKYTLDKLKIVGAESYDEVIQRLIMYYAESMTDLNDETKNLLQKQVQRIYEGRVKSFDEVLKEFKEKKSLTSGGADALKGMKEKRVKKGKGNLRGDVNGLGS